MTGHDVARMVRHRLRAAPRVGDLLGGLAPRGDGDGPPRAGDTGRGCALSARYTRIRKRGRCMIGGIKKSRGIWSRGLRFSPMAYHLLV